MNDLAGFSEWTLALLPRLFLYPGGLWLLVVIVGLRFSIAGKQAISPGALLSDLLRTDLVALATAWAAVALLPVGAATHTFPIDRLALVGLLAISLAFDRLRELRIANCELRIEIAILAAVVVPIAGQSTLLDANGGVSGWLSLFAVLLGMAALARQAGNSLSLGVRLVGWLGLAAAPILDYNWSLAAYTALVIAVGLAGRIAGERIKAERSMVAVWSLTALSLLAALLGPA